MNSLAPIFLASLSLLLGGACLSFPDAANPDDGGVPDDTAVDASSIDAVPEIDATSPDAQFSLVGNTITGDITNTTLSNGNLELNFSETNGFLIDSLVLAADLSSVPRNIIYQGAGNERYVGVHNWEESDYQWSASPSLTELARGEAVFRFQIVATQNELSVASIYTIYPDGRIHRDEDARITGLGSLSAYLALNPVVDKKNPSFTTVASSYDTPSNTFGTITSVDHIHDEAPAAIGTEEGWACVYGPELIMGMAHQIGAALTNNHRPRVTVSSQGPSGGNGTDPQVSLIFDWAAVGGGEADATPDTPYTGNFVMAGGATGSSGSECERISSLNSWLLTRPAQIDLGASTSILSGTDEGDDAGDGFNEGGGFWALRSENGSSLTFSIDTDGGNRIAPDRAAFRLHGLSLSKGQAPQVTLNSVPQIHGQDFLWQAEEFRGSSKDIVHWVYFGKALADDDILAFTLPSN